MEVKTVVINTYLSVHMMSALSFAIVVALACNGAGVGKGCSISFSLIFSMLPIYRCRNDEFGRIRVKF